MRKIVFGVVVLCLIALVSVGGYFVYNRLLREGNVPADIVTRPWVEYQLKDVSVFVDFPMPLNNKEMEKNNIHDSWGQSNNGDGLNLVACSSARAPECKLSMDYMADRFVEICKKDSVVISSKKTPTMVLGDSAVDLEMVIKKWWKPASLVRVLFFRRDDRLCQVHCNSGLDQPAADAVWERIKKSIRTQSGTIPAPNAGSVPAPNGGSVPATDGGITRGVPTLPKGLTRRPK